MFTGLKGKTALITGATGGIGKATALAAAAQGVNVVITGRRVAEGEAVVEQIRARGVKGEFVQGDITDEQHIQRAVQAAVKLGGGLHFAFNNAGYEGTPAPTVEATPDEYRRVFDINVLGVLLSMKHQIPAMLASGKGGSIVNNASVAGSIGMAGVGVYVASKHAVIGLTKCAALEVAKQGLRINTVSPAAIDTAMFDRFTGDRNPDALNYMASLHPVGRIGAADEIANPVLFLFSDASSFMTGHDLRVDGGLTVP